MKSAGLYPDSVNKRQAIQTCNSLKGFLVLDNVGKKGKRGEFGWMDGGQVDNNPIAVLSVQPAVVKSRMWRGDVKDRFSFEPEKS